jgi:hypothetical protein
MVPAPQYSRYRIFLCGSVLNSDTALDPTVHLHISAKDFSKITIHVNVC